MNSLYRTVRYVLFVPLILAGLLSLLAAQTTIIFGLIFAGIAMSMFRRKKLRRKPASESTGVPGESTDEEPSADVSAEMQAISVLPLRAITPQSLILIRGEICYLQEPATLIVQTPVGQRIGGLSRLMPPASGARLRPGFGHAQNGRRSKTAAITGTVYVTSIRIVFVGAINVNMNLAQILTLDASADGVALSFVNENPMTFETGNPRIGITLRKVINLAAEPTAPLR